MSAGSTIPLNTAHAVSVSLPAWSDNIAYELADPVLLNRMRGGYPRFVLATDVVKLCSFCSTRFAYPAESCLVFVSNAAAEACRAFIRSQSSTTLKIRTAEFIITPQSLLHRSPDTLPSSILASFDHNITHPVLHIVLFPTSLADFAKQFWQHTGQGISSRFAEHCLRILHVVHGNSLLSQGVLPESSTGTFQAQLSTDKTSKAVSSTNIASPTLPPKQLSKRNRFSTGPYSQQILNTFMDQLHAENAIREADTFVEERFGRNLHAHLGDQVKRTLRCRIAWILGDDVDGESSSASSVSLQSSTCQENDASSPESSHQHTSNRNVTENDVFLFSCGMSAIYSVHRAVMMLCPNMKSVQFGFPYIDTLKLQQKFGPGCHFLGHGSEQDYHQLAHILASEPISAIFCEFPHNPLLRTPDLMRLSKLARTHGCLLVVDDTIGNFLNVEVLSFCDIVVSSLTKLFSGDCNVMGGSAVVNPRSPHAPAIMDTLSRIYTDTFWCEDAIFLERNSRTFVQRNAIINKNTEAICDYLAQHPKVQSVFYPKYVNTDLYMKHARNAHAPGYGGLFSLLFHNESDAVKFYDAIKIHKGPSLGTNFTLACPYAILAHFNELEWAASYGVPSHLIRVSVGVEDVHVLMAAFTDAMRAL